MSTPQADIKMASLIAAANQSNDNEIPSVSDDHSSHGSKGEDGHTQGKLQPYPFFYYRDFSRVKDPNPSARNSLKGANNFPVKMHIILNDPELEDIVGWLPHGRSWRILRPREFERKVIPAFFEHTKFSSFIRQANGWGFRRVLQGRDRGSYYHEMFLKGMPHLCRKMKRPGKAMKITIDTDHEPDLYKISEMFPLPDDSQQEKAASPDAVPKEVVTSSALPPASLDAIAKLPTAGSAFVRPQQIPSTGSLASLPSPQPQVRLAGDSSSELLMAVLKACQERNAAQQQEQQQRVAVSNSAVQLLSAASSGTNLVNMAREQRAKEILLGLLTNSAPQASLSTSGLQQIMSNHNFMAPAPIAPPPPPTSGSDRADLMMEVLRMATSNSSSSFANQFRG